MDIILLVFLALLIILLFSIRKPSPHTLITANDLTSMEQSHVKPNKETNFANVLASISASLKIAMRDKTHMKQDVADDREQINSLIQSIKNRQN